MLKLIPMTALAGFLAAGVFAQNENADPARLKADIAKLKREISRVEADILRTDSLTRGEVTAGLATEERFLRDRERREKENQALEARVKETRAKISAEQSRLAGSKNAVEEIHSRNKALLRTLAALTDSLLLRIEAAPPWDLDARRDRLLSLKRDLEAGTPAPEEAFDRLTAILKDEIKSGDEIALFNRPVTRENGETVNAQILKLGDQVLVYVDEEGRNFGILEKRRENGKTLWGWREKLDTKEKSAVKRAILVKAGRTAPQLISLGIAFSLDSAAAEGGR